MLIKIRLEIREREMIIKIAVNSRIYKNRSLIPDFPYRCSRSILFHALDTVHAGHRGTVTLAHGNNLAVSSFSD